ncbi:MAG TPA: YihY/virulence factor BrkB family protein [Woeseiaceae bacterium]|nr:YihY/virulence factor BrkB family protein [Woeseiaceae bacterium]
MFGKLKEAGSIAWDSVRTFPQDNPFEMAAALAYFTLLSIAPLLLVIIGAAGMLMGEAQVREALVSQARQLVGSDGASLLQTVMQRASESPKNALSMIIGSVLTIFGATTIFAHLQKSLNRVWDVQAKPSNAVLGFARARLISLSVVLGLAFLMLASLVLQAAISGLQEYLATLFPGAAMLSTIINNLVSLTLVALVLAMLFRYVPDVEISWHDTIVGAVLTALLLTIGNYAIGLYLGHAAVGSAYGAAGSAVVFMVWVYYTAVVLFFGANTTKVIARHHGSPILPSEYAEFLPGAEPPQNEPRPGPEEEDSGHRRAAAG